VEAYQLYLRGRFHWNKRSLDGLPKAVEYFQQAIANDPDYAVAYAGLADAYNMLSFRNVLPANEAMPKAKAAATKALKLDPSRAEPHVSLGYASFTYDRDWPAAGRHFEQALALNRSYVLSHSHYALYLTSRSLSRIPDHWQTGAGTRPRGTRCKQYLGCTALRCQTVRSGNPTM